MIKLICNKCHSEYSPDLAIWKCKCGGLLNIALKPNLDTSELNKREFSIWRYREVIPIENDANIVSFREGGTPLLPIKIKGRDVLFKQDYLFPTCSFKDRGASVLISKIKELEISQIIIDSSGNAASSVAAYSAKANIKCIVLIPHTTCKNKIAQIKKYGAKIVIIKGTREDAAVAALKYSKKYYYASHYYNPFFLHGIKTFAYEVAEQLNWRAPDTVILPVGNGTLLLGAFIGFTELLNLKLIQKMPKLIAVQAKNCSPIAEAFKSNSSCLPARKLKKTVAEGIAIAQPVRLNEIINAIKSTNGNIITVSEKDILLSYKELSNLGLLVEPTSAVAFAAAKYYIDHAAKNELIVSTLTSHGLKSA